MTYLGELISIGVAFSWTATALLSEFGSKRLGTERIWQQALGQSHTQCAAYGFGTDILSVAILVCSRLFMSYIHTR